MIPLHTYARCDDLLLAIPQSVALSSQQRKGWLVGEAGSSTAQN